MPFLTAEWRDLLLLNYDVDPALLEPLVPPGVELADVEGKTFLSLVGFRFLKTRLGGLAIPFHRHFEEVNLRFYVRRRTPGGWRQGVVFIREIVPKWSIAWVARKTFGERYTSYPMRHRVAGGNGRPPTVEYWWYPFERLNHLSATLSGNLRRPEPDSVEAFLIDNHWGYVLQRERTREYRVEHPPWRIRPVREAKLDCDAAKIFGQRFAEPLSGPPDSAFYADGSDVAVYRSKPVE